MAKIFRQYVGRANVAADATSPKLLSKSILKFEFVRKRNGTLLELMRSLHAVGSEVAVDFVCIETAALQKALPKDWIYFVSKNVVLLCH